MIALPITQNLNKTKTIYHFPFTSQINCLVLLAYAIKPFTSHSVMVLQDKKCENKSFKGINTFEGHCEKMKEKILNKKLSLQNSLMI